MHICPRTRPSQSVRVRVSQADRDILEHIVYDFGDTEMMEALRPSIEEAYPIQSQEVALDFIGKRGSAVGVVRDKRIQYAREILQRELLPHVGIGELCETKKVRGGPALHNPPSSLPGV